MEDHRRQDLGVQASQGASSSTTAASSPPRTSCSRSTASRTFPTARARSPPTPRRSEDRGRRSLHAALQERGAVPARAQRLVHRLHRVKKVATGATTEDFNSGKAAIGSGRYKLVRYVNGDRIELVTNDGYWGDKPGYRRVTFRIIKNEAARMAALLSGDMDAIEQPPTTRTSRAASPIPSSP
ncbi:MAG: ABC transporter substrate-binding protein [Burkholderiales bacterium]